MNLKEMISSIEGIDFDIRYMILSSFSTVLLSLETDEVLHELIHLLNGNFDYQRLILKRIETLMLDYEESVRHTHDTAITVYLYALQAVASNGALEQVVYKIARQYEFWWARKLAQKIINEQFDTITPTEIVAFQLGVSLLNIHYITSTDTKSIIQAIPA